MSLRFRADGVGRAGSDPRVSEKPRRLEHMLSMRAGPRSLMEDRTPSRAMGTQGQWLVPVCKHAPWLGTGVHVCKPSTWVS